MQGIEIFPTILIVFGIEIQNGSIKCCQSGIGTPSVWYISRTLKLNNYEQISSYHFQNPAILISYSRIISCRIVSPVA